MDLLQLRYFQAVARREHVSRAAGDLRVAQPSLSRAIARLEAELGVPLFDRQGRRVQLNRFGTAFADRVDSVLAALDDARRELRDAAGLDRGTVSLAAETLLTLTGLLASFLAEHPGVRFRLFQSSAQTMVAQLGSGEVDLCLASQPLPGPLLDTLELASEEVLLAVPPAHRLASRSSVRIDELADEPFVTTRQASGIFRGIGAPLDEARALTLLSDAHAALGDSAAAAAALADVAALRATLADKARMA